MNLACNHLDVPLGYYPGDPAFQFLTKMPIVSKYFYLYPWIAEVGLSDVINSLKSKPGIVYIDLKYEVWGYKSKEYLSDLKTYLESANYGLIDGFYIPPNLMKECHSSQR